MKIQIRPEDNKNKDFKGKSVKMSFWSSDVWALFPATTQCISKLLSQKETLYHLCCLPLSSQVKGQTLGDDHEECGRSNLCPSILSPLHNLLQGLFLPSLLTMQLLQSWGNTVKTVFIQPRAAQGEIISLCWSFKVHIISCDPK